MNWENAMNTKYSLMMLCYAMLCVHMTYLISTACQALHCGCLPCKDKARQAVGTMTDCVTCLALSRAALSVVSWRSVARHSSSWARRRRSRSCSSAASWSWRTCRVRSLSPRAVLTEASCPFTRFSRSTSCSYTSCGLQARDCE